MKKISVKERHREGKNLITPMMISRNSVSIGYYSGVMKGTEEAETRKFQFSAEVRVGKLSYNG